MHWIKIHPVIDYAVRGLCVTKYPGHPKGCPNYGKKEGCPPGAQFYDQHYDLTQPVYAIFNRFDIGAHIAKMRYYHPTWSDRQSRCCLYWQAGARNQLKKHIIAFCHNNPGYHITTCPEAMGVNVTATMEKAGIILEWPPEIFAYQIAFAAVKKVGE